MLTIIYERIKNSQNGNPKFYIWAFLDGNEIDIKKIAKNEDIKKRKNKKGYIIITYNITNIFKKILNHFNVENEFQIIEL